MLYPVLSGMYVCTYVCTRFFFRFHLFVLSQSLLSPPFPPPENYTHAILAIRM